MSATKSGPLTIKRATFTEREKVGNETKVYTYEGFALRGWLTMWVRSKPTLDRAKSLSNTYVERLTVLQKSVPELEQTYDKLPLKNTAEAEGLKADIEGRKAEVATLQFVVPRLKRLVVYLADIESIYLNLSKAAP
jgi:hypothetical protein